MNNMKKNNKIKSIFVFSFILLLLIVSVVCVEIKNNNSLLASVEAISDNTQDSSDEEEITQTQEVNEDEGETTIDETNASTEEDIGETTIDEADASSEEDIGEIDTSTDEDEGEVSTTTASGSMSKIKTSTNPSKKPVITCQKFEISVGRTKKFNAKIDYGYYSKATYSKVSTLIELNSGYVKALKVPTNGKQRKIKVTAYSLDKSKKTTKSCPISIIDTTAETDADVNAFNETQLGFESLHDNMLKSGITSAKNEKTGKARVKKVTCSKVTVIKGKTTDAKYTVLPTDAYNKNVTVKVVKKYKTIAKVKGNRLYGKKVGTAYYTVTSKGVNKKGKRVTSKKCKVVVKSSSSTAKASINVKNASDPSKANQGKINYYNHTMIKGKTKQFTTSVSGLSKGTSKKLKWSTSNKKIVTVNSKGKISAKKAGTATITVSLKADTSIKSKIKVKVTANSGIKSIKVSPNKINIKVKDKKTITTTISPSTANSKKVTYKSANKKIATVNSSGQVTGKKKGTTKITVTSKIDSSKKKTVKVTVKKASTTKDSDSVKVEKITTTEKLSIAVGNKKKVKVSAYLPTNTTQKTVTYKSSKTKIATIDSDGTIHGIKAGTTTITVTAKANSKIKSTIKVTVTGKKNVSTIKITPSKATLNAGEKKTLDLVVSPSSVTNKKVTWKSSNKKVATVNSNGQVTAKKKGSCIITATSKSDTTKKDTTKITVKNQSKPAMVITSLTAQTNLTVAVGNKKKINITINKGASVKSIIFKSSNNKVATIDSDGTVHGLKVGTTTISMVAGNNKAQTVVTVTKKVDVNKLSMIPASTQKIDVGDELNLNVSVSPSSATKPSVTWKSSNNKIAKVDKNGTVKALKKGNCIITATSKSDSTKKTTIKVKVNKSNVDTSVKLETVKLSNTTFIGITESKHVYTVISPTNATNAKFNWISSDKKIVTVDSKGSIKGVKEGTAIVTATSKYDSKISSACTVTVTKKVVATAMKLSAETDEIPVGGYVKIKRAFVPENTSLQTVWYETDDYTKATVDQNGIVYGKKTGEVTITAISKSDTAVKAKIQIAISNNNLPTNLFVNPVKLNIGETSNVLVDPNMAINYAFISSNSHVATINEMGTVTATGYGDASIKVLNKATNVLEGYVGIHVKYPEENITKISCKNMEMNVNGQDELSISMSPTTNKNYEVISTSSNKKVATINESGIINPKKKGTTTITVRLKNNDSVKGTCKIKVVKKGIASLLTGVLSGNNKSTKKSTKKSTSKTTAEESNFNLEVIEKYIFVGDSRFKGMESSIKKEKNEKFIAQTSQGLKYLKSKKTEIKKAVNSLGSVIIGMGVNDLGNIDEYIDYVNSVNYGCKNIYFLTVNPTSQNKYKGSATNKNIDIFNKKLKNGAKNYKVIDTNSYIDKNFKIDEITDAAGLHYNNSANKKIYNFIKKNIK